MTDLAAPVDTDPEVYARQLKLIGALSKSERLGRMLALSAFARQMAWQGATRFAAGRGSEAVVDRFLDQLYGAGAARVRALLRRGE